jgi:uncharacterized protein
MNSPSQTSSLEGHTARNDTQPWWQYRMLWLVIGGPAIVVVASIATGIIAARGADPVLDHDEAVTQGHAAPADGALTPALQARNHAATPKP